MLPGARLFSKGRVKGRKARRRHRAKAKRKYQALNAFSCQHAIATATVTATANNAKPVTTTTMTLQHQHQHQHQLVPTPAPTPTPTTQSKGYTPHGAAQSYVGDRGGVVPSDPSRAGSSKASALPPRAERKRTQLVLLTPLRPPAGVVFRTKRSKSCRGQGQTASNPCQRKQCSRREELAQQNTCNCR